jgi:hypothetical protein
MKPSHFTTPRTLGDCSFIPSADPIERPSRSNYDAPFMAWAGGIIVGVLIAMGVAGWL